MPSNFKKLRIGDTFTPLEWGIFAIEQFGLFDQWMSGKSIFDPTMGEGNLLEALIEYGLSQGHSMDQLPTHLLFGNELNGKYYQRALQKFKRQYGLDMQENFSNEDILTLEARIYDLIFGNPPWQNFVDLPSEYKEGLKPLFHQYGLVGKDQNLLLGGSRIELAALIIQRSIQQFLTKGGQAYFFLPLSIFLNEGANTAFRNYRINSTEYAPSCIYDFNKLTAFPEISTRYGLVHFRRDKQVHYPLEYYRYEQEEWRFYKAKPLLHPQAPLSIFCPKEERLLARLKPISISKASSPRQGINTAGANAIFFFKEKQEIDSETCLLNGQFKLPSHCIFPLLTKECFGTAAPKPLKWALLPYHSNGKVMKGRELEQIPLLWEYLLQHREILQNRKGSLIQGYIKRGLWWALLGVGPYNFSPYKVVWEAYGRREFKPIIVKGNWQANQSLQAFMPAKSMKEAEKILQQLSQPAVDAYLKSLKMGGTMSWAQPGKIKPLLKIS